MKTIMLISIYILLAQKLLWDATRPIFSYMPRLPGNHGDVLLCEVLGQCLLFMVMCTVWFDGLCMV